MQDYEKNYFHSFYFLECLFSGFKQLEQIQSKCIFHYLSSNRSLWHMGRMRKSKSFKENPFGN